jgi:zinc-ribbon domain
MELYEMDSIRYQPVGRAPMATLDNFIEMMVQRNGERAVLVSDQPSQIFVNGQKTEARTLSAVQLREALEEVTPEDLRPHLRDGGSFHFRYNSLLGVYEVGVATFSDTIQLTLSPGKPETLTTPRETSSAHQAPLTPQRPTTVVPNSVQVPALVAPQQTFCQRCGAPNALVSSFCTSCGQPFNPPVVVTGVGSGVVAPQQPQNIVNVSVQQKSSGGGWLAALAVALFATPLGCIAIPTVLVLLVLAVSTGLVFAPMILAIVGAVIVWKLQAVKPEHKVPMIAGLLVVGGVVQVLMFSR